MSLSIAALMIYGFVAFVVVAAFRRLADQRGLPVWIKPALLACAVVPVGVGALLLNPGEPLDVSRLAHLHEKDTIEVPANSSLLVRGVLADLELLDSKKLMEAAKTNYAFSVAGEGWSQTASGEIRRKTDSGGNSAQSAGGASLKDSRRARAAALGEDLEQRFEIPSGGTLKLELTNWQGGAVEAILVEVVPAPPARPILWALTGVAALLGLVAEVRYRAIQLAGDMAFLCAFAVFLPDQVTPASGFQEAGTAAFGAALLGWLGVGGLAWLLMKAQEAREARAAKR